MPGDVTKTNHEPVWAVFNGTNLGLIDAGDVTVTFNEEWVDQMSHQTGGFKLESYYKGGSPTINIKALEVQTLANWEVAFPYGSPQSSSGNSRFSPTLVAAGSTTPYAGMKASAVTHPLILRPAQQYADASTEKSRDLYFMKAWCRSVGAMNFSIDNPQALDLTFDTLFDTTAGEGQHIWFLGLLTGTWIDA